MKDRRVSRIQDVASLIAENALLPVAQAAEEVRRIEMRVESISRHRLALQRSVADPTLAATMLGQAERLRVSQSRALSDLAAAKARLEIARAKAASAVGRDRAVAKLAERLARKEQQRLRRGQSS